MKNEKGRLVPVNKVRRVGVLQKDLLGGDPTLVVVTTARSGEFLYVSHFEVCPDAKRAAEDAARRRARRSA